MFRASPIPPRPRSPPPQEGSPGPLKINEDPMSPRSEHDANPISSSQDKDDPQQHYCLKWNNYQTNLTSVFDHLLQTEAFVDVTLTSEGQVIKCHKVVLSACSPYFQSLLSGNPSQHPIVILRDIPWADLKYIVEYMYRGEINVGQDELPSVLKSSEALNIRGLVDFRSSNQGQLSSPNKDVELKPCSNKGPPPLIDFRPHKRKRTSSSSFDEPNVISPSLSRPEPTDPHSPYHTREDCSALEMGLPLGPPSMSSSFQTRTSHPARSPSSSQSTPQGAHSAAGSSSHSISKPKNQIPSDDLSDVKPGIMELIQEERRAKLLEASQITHSWMNHHHHQQQQQQQQKTGASGTSLSNVRRESSPIPDKDLVEAPGTSSTVTSPVTAAATCTTKRSSPSSSFRNDESTNNNNSLASSIKPKASTPNKSGSKQPAWSQEQLQEAIYCVITQRMRFTQASTRYGIPKGTLYDNILGKSKRMKALEEISLSHDQEILILEFCCEISLMPYNRRTSRSLRSIVSFVEKMINDSVTIGEVHDPPFKFSLRKGFRWWWAFCKKYSIISLYFDNTHPLGDVTTIDLDSDTFADLQLWEGGHDAFHPPPAHTRPVMCGGAPTSIPFSFHAHAHLGTPHQHPQHDLSHLYTSFLNAHHASHPYLSTGLNYPQNLSLPQSKKTLKHFNEN